MREMNIPGNWKILDLAWGMSFTTVASPNTTPSNQNAPGYSSVLDRSYFGIKDSSMIAPGLPGSKFMGIGYSGGPNDEQIITSGFEGMKHAYDTSYGSVPRARWSDGSSVNIIVAGGPFSNGDPTVASGIANLGADTVSFTELLNYPNNITNSTSYFAWRVMRLRRDNADRIKIRSFSLRNQTDASDSALRTLFTNVYWGDDTVSNYPYILTTTPQGWTDLTHMYFRAPFTGVRARIHNYGYRLVS